MKRRSFLTLLGAAPLAAKAAAEAEMAKQIGMNSGSGLLQGGVGVQSMVGGSTLGGGLVDYEKQLTGASEYIRMFGLPATIEREVRQNTWHVHGLDPDLACKKSWSMSVKIMTQRQRQYSREVERMTNWGWQIKGREAISKFIGFRWPW